MPLTEQEKVNSDIQSLNTLHLNTNNQTLPHIDYPGKINKPLISLQLVNNDGKLEEFDALLDPGSYSEAPYSLEVEADIVSYISSSLAKKIKNEFTNSVATCTNREESAFLTAFRTSEHR